VETSCAFGLRIDNTQPTTLSNKRGEYVCYPKYEGTRIRLLLAVSSPSKTSQRVTAISESRRSKSRRGGN
jgi:hypothetical protein